MKIIVSQIDNWGSWGGIELATDEDIVKFFESNNRPTMEAIAEELQDAIEEVYENYGKDYFEKRSNEIKEQLSDKARELVRYVERYRKWYDIDYYTLRHYTIAEVEKGKLFKLEYDADN